ncbi:MAG: glycosyltransferase [Prevotella sp.]|uniref:glycosyltransferase n=1 Tax=Prevotella sp. TaxID=59823 RepID=UPI002A33C1A4|nr:glycosyltransferase [Prevotella sp.]MDD7318613.1 glycosyltransferase [Prevotellaceae bacterium]MDY4019431.1 glycosyltransferase [Prevotella sp.]
MRITYLLNSTRLQNGATKSFMALLENAVKAGVEPTVVVPDSNGVHDKLVSMGLDVLVLNYRPAVYPWLDSWSDALLFLPRLMGRIYLNRRASKKLVKHLKNNATDIIHTNVSVIDVGFMAAKKLHVPHIYHIREYADKDFNMFHYPTKRHFISRLQSPRCYSVCITNDIRKHNKQESNLRSTVIYNGISHSATCSTGQASTGADSAIGSTPYFLFAGRIEEAKGIDMLMQGYISYARQCKSSPLPLYLAGDIPNQAIKQAVENDAAQNGLEGKVKFLGARNDMENLMRGARAIIITSRFEAFGRCMPEAMLCGCLAIARNTGGTLEQLENGKRFTGEDIALRFDTPDELSGMLRKAETMSDEEYRSITNNALKTVKELYSPETYANSILSLYRKILSRRPVHNKT